MKEAKELEVVRYVQMKERRAAWTKRRAPTR
jgi:hypothetical protein